MQVRLPKLCGSKVPVTAYIDLNTFVQLEEERGLINRSVYLGEIIENRLKNVVA